MKKPDLVFIDDYAHHPEELRALINGAKSLFPDRRCSLIFQPHLFSRTRDFADEFAGVLSLVDNLILLPIYPARELPMEGVNSEMILKKTALESKAVLSKEALMGWMENQFAANRNMEFGELVITAGAGDIDKLVEPIKQILTR